MATDFISIHLYLSDKAVEGECEKCKSKNTMRPVIDDPRTEQSDSSVYCCYNCHYLMTKKPKEDEIPPVVVDEPVTGDELLPPVEIPVAVPDETGTTEVVIESNVVEDVPPVQ